MSLTAPTLRQLRRLVTVVETRGAPWPEVGKLLDLEIEMTPEPRELVFALRIPLFTTVLKIPTRGKRKGIARQLRIELAPLLNAYAGMLPWALHLSREHLDGRIMAELPRWPYARDVSVMPHPVRRLVRATRYSSMEPDEICLGSGVMRAS